jgi:DNA-binding MarR family transcriptional regulator
MRRPNIAMTSLNTIVTPLVQPETIVQQIAVTYNAMLAMFERHVGMSKARWQVLVLLQREGEVSQASMQQQLKVDGAAITRQVKQLEEEGLVLRRADPQDNRFTLVTLTATGRQLAAGMHAKRESFESLVTSGLAPEDLAVMRQCLQQIRQNMRALGEPT